VMAPGGWLNKPICTDGAPPCLCRYANRRSGRFVKLDVQHGAFGRGVHREQSSHERGAEPGNVLAGFGSEPANVLAVVPNDGGAAMKQVVGVTAVVLAILAVSGAKASETTHQWQNGTLAVFS
jgi:hypothetical protein